MTYPRRGSAERKTPVWVGLVIHPNIITLLRNGNLCNTLRKRKKNHKDGKVSGEMLPEEPGDSPVVGSLGSGWPSWSSSQGEALFHPHHGPGELLGAPEGNTNFIICKKLWCRGGNGSIGKPLPGPAPAMQPCLQFSPEHQHGHTWDKKRQRRMRKPQPPAGLGVCDFCSFQGTLKKKVIGKAAAREVALLFVFWFLKLSVETFYSGRRTALSLQNTWLCQKKAFFWGNETLLLEKTIKSHPAHTGSQLRSWGAAAVHPPSPCSQSFIPVHHNGESILVVPTDPSAWADLHSLHSGPWTPTLAQLPCKAPQKPFRLFTWEGAGFPAGAGIVVEEPNVFWCFTGNQQLMRRPQGESWSPGKAEEAMAFKKDELGL